MLDRFAYQDRRKVAGIITRAVNQSRTPGAGPVGFAPASTAGSIDNVPSLDEQFSRPEDGEGNTPETFTLGADTLGDPNARLRVQGNTTD